MLYFLAATTRSQKSLVPALVVAVVWVTSADSVRAQVSAGIDVLERHEFRELKGKRIGLVTNQTGANRRGVSTVQLMHESQHVNLVALFSPEHGFAGKLDQAQVDDGKDPLTGLKIYSLYGKNRVPTAEMLAGVDTLVFDIQDIGTRFYTYISTMGGSMRVAAEHKVTFVVLDRPNPIDGVTVQGPILDAGSESFVGYHTLPVRHGMTVGELAMMFKDEFKLDLDLTVVRAEGWRRHQRFDETGRLWINPSPNMRSFAQALLYPGIGLLETTNVSVGRGTDTPFEVFGAPWMDAIELAGELNKQKLRGVRFVPIQFTPSSSKHAAKLCSGVNFVVTDHRGFQPVKTGLALAITVRKLYPEQWETKSLNRLLANRVTYEGIKSGKSLEQLCAAYEKDLDDFKVRRRKYLIYE